MDPQGPLREDLVSEVVHLLKVLPPKSPMGRLLPRMVFMAAAETREPDHSKRFEGVLSIHFCRSNFINISFAVHTCVRSGQWVKGRLDWKASKIACLRRIVDLEARGHGP